jgi:hypothetical protein
VNGIGYPIRLLLCLCYQESNLTEHAEQGSSPEVWSGCHLEGKASQVDHPIRQQEEHGHKRCNGVQTTEEKGHLRERIQSNAHLIAINV